MRSFQGIVFIQSYEPEYKVKFSNLRQCTFNFFSFFLREIIFVRRFEILKLFESIPLRQQQLHQFIPFPKITTLFVHKQIWIHLRHWDQNKQKAFSTSLFINTPSPVQPIKCHCCPQIETSQLIYTARATLAINWLIGT